VSEHAEGLRIDAAFADALFDAGTVRGWLDQWVSLMLAAAESPERVLERLDDADSRHPAEGADSPLATAGPGTPGLAVAAPWVAAGASRRGTIAAKVVELLVPLSGRDASQISLTETFVEQGFNSLSLTQVANAIYKAFGVKLTFGQLINKLPNVEMVAASLDERLAPEAFAAPAPVAAAPAAQSVGQQVAHPTHPTAAVAAVPAALAPVPPARPIPIAQFAMPEPMSLDAVLVEQAQAVQQLHRVLDRMAGPDAAHDVSPPVPAPRARDGFFFGPSQRRLFGRLHTPSSGPGRELTVICPPLFSEYTRTWLALRRVSASLAERGQHVLRFDWRGTGDSSGDLDVVSASDWIEDVGLAIGEGMRMTGAREVNLVGVRAGALLACTAAASRDDVRRVVAWDPVPDGAVYLNALRRIQANKVKRYIHLDRAACREALREYSGFRLSDVLVGQIEALGGGVYDALGPDRLHVVATSAEETRHFDGFGREVVEFACRWDIDSEDILNPSAVLERITKCLTRS
jgi:pimeloyl-ACP methyl ester carboxylesterase/acyl carrier protein